MAYPRLDTILIALLTSTVLAGPLLAAEDGLAELDQATELKISADGMDDLNKVIELVDTALEKGLDESNQQFAEELLISTLIQRAKAFASAIRSTPITAEDNRWMQIRQFALTDLQRAVMLDNNQWEAHLLIGQLHLLGEANATRHTFSVDAARRALNQVVENENVPEKELAEAYALRGALRKEKEDRLSDFNKAVELQPHRHNFLLLRAQHYYRIDDFAAAMNDIDKALEIDPEEAVLHDLRGKILLSQEKFDEAKTSFDRASELAPDSLVPYQRMGEVYLQQGDLQKAIEQLTKALEVQPDDAKTLLIRASVHYQSGDVEAALADIDDVLEINRGLVKAYELKADILAAENRFDDAIDELSKVLSAAPDRPELLPLQYRVATYHLVNDQPAEAADAFTKVLKLDESNVDALRARGDAYLQTGNHAAAIEDFEAALKHQQDDDRLLNNLAWVLATSPHEELRDGERAIELASQACDLTAYEAPHILSTLAAAYAETGDFDSAVKFAEQANEKAVNSPDKQQLADELASYKEHKPWRELKQVGVEADSQTEGDGKPAIEDQTFAPPSAAPAPARTIDY